MKQTLAESMRDLANKITQSSQQSVTEDDQQSPTLTEWHPMDVKKNVQEYADAMNDAVKAAGAEIFDIRAGKAKNGLIGIKVEIRKPKANLKPGTRTHRDNTQNVSRDPSIRNTIVSHLDKAGYKVSKITGSHFEWRFDIVDSSTFFIVPKEQEAVTKTLDGDLA
jgi:predicted RNA binding protein YcfA (HicA-like mRNA interferase family)